MSYGNVHKQMVGARGITASGGSGWTNPYITDGLIAMWDGEWNAGGGVHDSAETTWQNLAQDKWHLNVASETTWLDKCLHSTNTQYYMAGLPGAENAISPSESQTIEIVISYIVPSDSYPVYGRNMFFASNTTSGPGLRQIGVSEAGKLLPCNYGSNTYIYHETSGYVSNTIMQLRAMYSPSGVATSFTKNGIDGKSLTATFNRNTNAGLFIGGSGLTESHNKLVMNGDMYSIRIYSRSLTAAEIAANYSVDKERFGLP